MDYYILNRVFTLLPQTPIGYNWLQGGTEVYNLPVTSVQSCQQQCQQNDLCQFFVYAAISSYCYIRYNSTGSFSFTNYTTGPKFCPGYTIQIRLLQSAKIIFWL